MHPDLTPLPIDSLLGEISNAVKNHRLVVVHASPGSGKTTRIPPCLLKTLEGRILVLEPRRIAARLAAERVSSERGEKCGDLVGYQVRYDDRSSPRTRLKFITEGLLMKYMVSNPLLEGVHCVILDEFHERHLHTDSALALLSRLQEKERPDLRLVIMSATLDTAGIMGRFDDTRAIECRGLLHELSIHYQDAPDNRPLHARVLRAARECFEESATMGHVLVFLPGFAEIRAAREALGALASHAGADLLELRSEMPFEEQARVFAPSAGRKIILSTNIAETSVTIEGVTAVIDSGLARIAGFAHWSGLPTLDVKAICRASCDQRAGRAGRTAPGVVKRLYTKSDYLHRKAFELPEVARCDLTQMLLDMKIILAAMGDPGANILQLPWIEPPPGPLVEQSLALLIMLGALDGRGALSARGKRLALLPLHPRLARIVLEGEKLGCGPQALLSAALLSEGMILRRTAPAPDRGESDVGRQRGIYIAVEQGKHLPGAIHEHVDRGRIAAVRRLIQAAAPSLGCTPESTGAHLPDDALSEILLAGFPDRVCQIRTARGKGPRKELNFCMGGGGTLSPSSVVQDSPFLIALEADEQTAGTRGAMAVQVRVASAVSPELLTLAGNDFLKVEKTYGWDREAERVRCHERLYYGELVLEERAPPPDSETCEEVLFQALKDMWPSPFQEKDSITSFQERCRVVSRAGFTVECPDLEGPDFDRLLRHVCRGKRSFSEIRSHSLEYYIEGLLSPQAKNMLARYAPSHIQIGCNRRAEIHYDRGKEPWVASRLQDFFGTVDTPRIGEGRIPLTVHLLAPNKQAVQVTSDLAGFWSRMYPGVRKELSRRYPRHYWPENPMEAEPRLPGRRKG